MLTSAAAQDLSCAEAGTDFTSNAQLQQGQLTKTHLESLWSRPHSLTLTENSVVSVKSEQI